MKKNLLILLILLMMLPMMAVAQKHNVGLSAGVAVPIGNFSKVSGDDAGFANPGFSYGVSYAYEVAEGHQIGFSTGVSWFPLDIDAAEEETGVKFDQASFTSIPFMPYYQARVPLTDVFHFETQLHLGVLRNTYPAIGIGGTTIQAQESSINFALGFQAGFSFDISDTYSLGIRSGYYLNNASFDDFDQDMWAVPIHFTLVTRF